ncbi:MAG: hypothetical protein IT252_02195 [Chitinophagaceae bacterium]|nr:hypothetical protein [Chitinophagaceae bacterium]
MAYKKHTVLAALVIGIGLISGCYKYTIVAPETGAEVTRTVSFKEDLLPIFNNSCNMSGCHNNGGKAPDLSAANAFNTLTSGTTYVNTNSPETSGLYLWMMGKKGTPMPLSGPNKDYNALVLAWIKQGAKNN